MAQAYNPHAEAQTVSELILNSINSTHYVNRGKRHAVFRFDSSDPVLQRHLLRIPLTDITGVDSEDISPTKALTDALKTTTALIPADKLYMGRHIAQPLMMLAPEPWFLHGAQPWIQVIRQQDGAALRNRIMEKKQELGGEHPHSADLLARQSIMLELGDNGARALVPLFMDWYHIIKEKKRPDKSLANTFYDEATKTCTAIDQMDKYDLLTVGKPSNEWIKRKLQHHISIFVDNIIKDTDTLAPEATAEEKDTYNEHATRFRQLVNKALDQVIEAVRKQDYLGFAKLNEISVVSMKASPRSLSIALEKFEHKIGSQVSAGC